MKRLIGVLQNLLRLVTDEPVAQVVFVLEIEIESPLCHACLFRNIGNGCIGNSLLCEEIKSIVQQGFAFPALVLTGLSLRTDGTVLLIFLHVIH